MIHKTTTAGGSRFVRLYLTDIIVREKMLRANNDDELNNIFHTDGFLNNHFQKWFS